MKKVIVSLVLSFILVTLSLQGIPFQRMAEALRQVQPLYIFLSVILLCLGQVLQSISWEMIRKPIAHVTPFTLFSITKERWDEVAREVLHLLSMVFSNTVGLVEIRRGKLYQRKDVLLDIHNILKSGDILLDKTPFRLTDKLIPGYWGHAALWIGTKTELKDMGIWNHPIVTRYHKEIRKGKMVVEALRSGVEMNTLEHFLNIDSIGILRKPDQNGEDRAGTIIRALYQVGKPYDFNFEVETRNRVYCSKLVYLSYASVEWPTRKSLGRATITPDDVAIPAALHGKLELVSFYHDGRRIDDRPAVKMAQLMRLEVN